MQIIVQTPVVSFPSPNIDISERTIHSPILSQPHLRLPQAITQKDSYFSLPDIHYEFTRATSQHFKPSESRVVFVSVYEPTIASVRAQTRTTRRAQQTIEFQFRSIEALLPVTRLNKQSFPLMRQ